MAEDVHMIRPSLLLLAALAGLTTALPPAARAALVTVEFRGGVVALEDPFGVLTEIVPLTPLTGSYFYDDEAAVEGPCDPPGTFRPCQVYTFGPEAGIVLDIGDTRYTFLNSEMPETPLSIELRMTGSTTGVYNVRWRRVFEPLPGGSGTLTLDEFLISAVDGSPGNGFITGTDLVVPDFSLADVDSLTFVAREELTPASFDPTRSPPFIPTMRATSLFTSGLEFVEAPEPVAALLLPPMILFGLALRYGWARRAERGAN